MFGLLRPCRHHLDPEAYARWSAHLCGLCLTLRDEAGQLARTTTHVDAIVVSVLAEAQGATVGDRRAGPCPLRGMRPASVAGGAGARLAASTALLLAADAVDDHVRDRDAPFRSSAAATVGTRVATTWAAAGSRAAAAVGFDPATLLAVGARQSLVEAGVSVSGVALQTLSVRESTPSPGGGEMLAAATEPTEDAVAASFAHTAVLAGRPGNAQALSEAGRLLGRLAHLLDAVADRDDDRRAVRWNPLDATGTSTPDALARCADAVRGIRAALRRVDFDPARGVARRLVHALLAHETGRALDRTAAVVGHPAPPASPAPGRAVEIEWTSRRAGATESPLGGEPIAPLEPGRAVWSARSGPGPEPPPGGEPIAPWDPSQAPPEDDEPEEDDVVVTQEPPGPIGKQRGLLAGCAAAVGLCCTCRLCCADQYPGPWSGQPRQGWCRDVGCDCCDCGDCCCDCDCCGCDC